MISIHERKEMLRKLKLGLKIILTGATLVTSSTTVLAEETIANNYSGVNQETVTVIHHDKDDLTSDQLGQIVSGMPEISSLVCGNIVHFVFEKNGNIVTIGETSPGSLAQLHSSSTVEKVPSKIENLTAGMIGKLPNTGSKDILGASFVGFITLGSAVYLLYRHKKIAKGMVVFLILVGSSWVSLSTVHANVFNVPYKESKVDFKTPELNDYVYVGYWIEHGVCEISINSESTDEIIIENISTNNSNSSLDTSAAAGDNTAANTGNTAAAGDNTAENNTGDNSVVVAPTGDASAENDAEGTPSVDKPTGDSSAENNAEGTPSVDKPTGDTSAENDAEGTPSVDKPTGDNSADNNAGDTPPGNEATEEDGSGESDDENTDGLDQDL